MKKLTFIVNPISGRTTKENIVNTIVSHIDMSKYDVTIRFSSYAGHATEIAVTAVQGGADIIVAVGGDGTINEVARALVGTDVALGIIPCGSGNGLARHLHIPMNVRKAVEIVNDGSIDKIDTLSVNGIPCFCTAGVGYDAYVSAEYAKDSSRGLATYVQKAVQGWFSSEPQEHIIETDTQILKRKAVSITCANANQWGNEFHIAPQASLKDGLMDITIIHPVHFKHAVSMPAQILGYSFDKNPDVETIRAKKVLIRKFKSHFIHIDGESMMISEDLNFEIYNRSLKILVNKDCILL